MPNYYEILQVPETASPEQVDEACTRLYDKWRHLVTHHDPNVAGQAGQALQTLESIRTTLMDPTRRTGYDAALGVAGPVGGLADLDLLRQPGPLSPVAPQRSMGGDQAVPTGQRVDVWTCPKCQAANPARTRYCDACGQAIGRDCPNTKCGALIKVASRFCPECGVDLDQLSRETRNREEEQERLSEERRRWLSAVRGQFRGGAPCLKSVVVLGNASQVFEALRTVLKRDISYPTSGGSHDRVRLKVKSEDPRSGYIKAEYGSWPAHFEFEIRIQVGDSPERVVAMTANGPSWTTLGEGILEGLACALPGSLGVRSLQ